MFAAVSSAPKWSYAIVGESAPDQVASTSTPHVSQNADHPFNRYFSRVPSASVVPSRTLRGPP